MTTTDDEMRKLAEAVAGDPWDRMAAADVAFNQAAREKVPELLDRVAAAEAQVAADALTLPRLAEVEAIRWKAEQIERLSKERDDLADEIDDANDQAYRLRYRLGRVREALDPTDDPSITSAEMLADVRAALDTDA